jgi:hypothetical protein
MLLLGMGLHSTTTNIKMNTKWAWLCKTCRSHPASTPLHDTFYVMISVTFECERHANWPFLLQVDVARDGSTKTNIKMNTKWWLASVYCTCFIMMQHVSFSPNLYTTARFSPNLDITAWQFYGMIPVAFKREGHANWPARLQVELYNGNWKIINKHCISWNMLKI